MSLDVLSPTVFGFGAVALAGVLFLLARLRVRHAERVVPTTLFWKQALEDTHARELVQRFRHPWAYALTCSIALLLWLAFAGLRSDVDETIERVIVVDGSALDATRWERLREVLPQVIDGFARGTTRTVFAGEVPATLHEGDEPARLAVERLDALPRSIAPRSLERTLVALARSRTDERPLEITIVAPTPVAPETLALLDEDVTITALALEGFQTDGNRGITVLGVGAARSGRFDTVDVRIVETGPVGEDPIVSLDDSALRLERVERDANSERRVGVLRDVPANGRTLRVTFPTGDAFPADDAAAVTLPRRTPIRVRLALEDENLRAVLERDPGVRIVEEDAELTIGTAGDLAFVAPGTEEHAFQLLYDDARDADDALLEAWDRLGLGLIDGTGLAEEMGAVIGVGALAAERRAIRVRADLLLPDYDFVGSRAFPLFVAGAVRWLARVDPLVAEVRAGDPLASRAERWSSADERTYDSAGFEFTPPFVGRFAQEPSGDEVWASLLDAELSRGGRGDLGSLGEPVAVPSERGIFDLIGWLAFAVLLVLGLEWWLVQRGRMP